MKALFHKIVAAWRDRSILLKMVSFAMIGAVNANFCLFILCYAALSFPLVASNAVSWVAAVATSYLLNTTITFSTQVERFSAVCRFRLLVEVIARGTLVWLSHRTMIVVAKGISLVIGFGVNFSISNFVVFRRTIARNELAATAALSRKQRERSRFV
jgi:putative flippase GtrA